jgi:predicted RNA-binding Zn-ribbon protein involved in translation (DUF1610 family)
MKRYPMRCPLCGRVYAVVNTKALHPCPRCKLALKRA